MKIASLQKKKPLAHNSTVFTRVSDTEGQIHKFDGDGWSNSNIFSVTGTIQEMDVVESLYKQMAEIHSAEEPKFVTVSSAFAVADTVMVESPPVSEVRPASAKKALAAPNKALIRRLA
jgi:hypothetical protein